MNAKKLARVLPAGLGLLALTLLAGCTDFPSWTGRAKCPTDAQIAAVLERTADPVAMQPAAPAQPTTLLAATGP